MSTPPPEADAPQPGPPEGWTAADLALENRLEANEARMARDEGRIAQEERWLRRSWRLETAMLAMLALTGGALFMSWFALNRDVEAVARAAPKQDSVGTGAIRSGAVTGDKLADGAVTASKLTRGAVTAGALAPRAVGAAALAPKAVGAAALAPASVGRLALATGAVGPNKLADAAVTGRAIADGSITGVDVAEHTLTVGSATRATSAVQARNAASLGGVAAGRYVSRVTLVRQASTTSTLRARGPITATCPAGTRVIAGGAAVDGSARGVALVSSAPEGDAAWTAEAAAAERPAAPWRLVVTAICADGG
ncbi:MAG: hypothetical protein IT200_03900 [Thermoleophilia bacterium]|nr:hypothetical protein [Thermoleophilia bacterium]